MGDGYYLGCTKPFYEPLGPIMIYYDKLLPKIFSL